MVVIPVSASVTGLWLTQYSLAECVNVFRLEAGDNRGSGELILPFPLCFRRRDTITPKSLCVGRGAENGNTEVYCRQILRVYWESAL